MSYTNGLDKPTDYFNTKLYTGNGSNANAITGVGFQPDWTWIKQRDGADNHVTSDAVRGGNKQIYTNLSNAETSSTAMLQSFNSDGFTLGTDGAVNRNGNTYVSWNWLGANGTASNSNGSITSTVSANTTSGFSIVKWTGSGSSATLGHGLGSTPKCIIVKNRTDSVNWFLYNHAVITASSTNKIFMTLNDDRAIESNGTATTFTSVSDTTFGVGTDNIINGSSDNMIAYVFAEKPGFSKFSSYTGNGSTDGAFVYTGFSPAMMIIKKTNGQQEWGIYDNKRDPFNVADHRLFPNLSSAVSTSTDMLDFTSNGFKCRTPNDMVNASGGTYIYMAFAENPFVTSTGVPATAR